MNGIVIIICICIFITMLIMLLHVHKKSKMDIYQCPICGNYVLSSNSYCRNCSYPMERIEKECKKEKIRGNERNELIQFLDSEFVTVQECPVCGRKVRMGVMSCSTCGYPTEKMNKEGVITKSLYYKDEKICLGNEEYVLGANYYRDCDRRDNPDFVLKKRSKLKK